MSRDVGLRIFLAFLLSIFGTTSGHELQDECVSVEVSGSLHHLDTNGIYLLDSNICNSRHQWIHESGRHYLYYVLDGYDGWMIGLWSCHWGDFLISAKSTKEQPYEIQQSWRESVDELSSWKNNTQLQVQCVDNVRYNNQPVNCQMQPCKGAASCITKNGTSKCLCQHGFYGRFCETAIDTNHCNSSPCRNGATCSDLVNDFQCKCALGFSGRQCDILTDIDCEATPCHEHCPNKPELSCNSIRYVVAVACLCAVVIIVVLTLTYIARCIYLKQHNTPVEKSSAEDESFGWKDVSYKRLESLDSVLTMDRVGI